MKKTFFLALLITLSSCTTFKIVSNQEIQTSYRSEKIELKDNMILMNCDIENNSQKLLVDLGATMSVILDTTTVPNFYKKNKGTFGSVTSANGKKNKITFIALNVKNSLIQSDNKAFVVVPMQNDSDLTFDCKSNGQLFSSVGIFGYDFFRKEDLVYQLDFTSSKISFFKVEDLPNFVTENYREIKAEFEKQWISIFVTINDVEYKFKVDTGFNGTFTIPYNEKINFLKEDHLGIKGNLYGTISGKSDDKTDYFYTNKKIRFDNSNVETLITVSNAVKAQNVGMGFIKGYDWIVDNKSKKIYVKKNDLEIVKQSSFTKKYFVIANNHKLKILAKNELETKYNVGDEIIAINNQKITPENICEMQTLLNNTDDWNTLKIEIRSK